MDIDTGIVEINLEDIIPNRFQPRLTFDEKALNELAASIKQHGIIQPLVLRKVNDKYEIIAGERRYKAAGIAGLTKVPAVITNIDDNASAEVALIENVQRKNLTAIEEAKSYKKLLDKGYLTQDDLAKRMGLSQSAISNKLRLLNLDLDIQEALLNEKISERHARSLLQIESHEEQKKWLNKIITERMTVRQLDMELKKMKGINTDTTDVPLVNLTPDIEQIKNNAMDLNPTKEAVTLNEFKDVSNVPIELPKSPETANKFFNFLEDEAVNMSVNPLEENTLLSSLIDTPPIPNAKTEIEVLDVQSSTPTPNVVETFDETDKEETLSNEQVATLQELLNESISSTTTLAQPAEPIINIEPLPESPKESSTTVVYQPKEEVLDPVSMIERLDPEYENKIKREAGLDLNSAINMVRDNIKNMETKGFYIETEEVDFPNSYQIIINIGKDK